VLFRSSTSNYELVLETGDRLILNTNDFSVEDSGVLLTQGWDIADQDPLADNTDFNIEAQSILDFSEINPFGEVITDV
jgi:hypothetical protein